jgi:hypothetical protein
MVEDPRFQAVFGIVFISRPFGSSALLCGFMDNGAWFSGIFHKTENQTIKKLFIIGWTFGLFLFHALTTALHDSNPLRNKSAEGLFNGKMGAGLVLCSD